MQMCVSSEREVVKLFSSVHLSRVNKMKFNLLVYLEEDIRRRFGIEVLDALHYNQFDDCIKKGYHGSSTAYNYPKRIQLCSWNGNKAKRDLKCLLT